jgi:hypothetical protein
LAIRIFYIITIYPTEDDGSGESKAKATFLADPVAPDNFKLLIDIQYVKFLQINTDDEELMKQGRLMMAVTTHIYLLYLSASDWMKEHTLM